MGRSIVEHNGKYACFSSFIDDFITPFMSWEEYQVWHREDYIERYEPLDIEKEKRWLKSMDEIIHSIRFERPLDETILELEKLKVPSETLLEMLKVGEVSEDACKNCWRYDKKNKCCDNGRQIEKYEGTHTSIPFLWCGLYGEE